MRAFRDDPVLLVLIILMLLCIIALILIPKDEVKTVELKLSQWRCSKIEPRESSTVIMAGDVPVATTTTSNVCVNWKRTN